MVGALLTLGAVDITSATTAHLVAKWHMKRDTVIARLRRFGATEY